MWARWAFELLTELTGRIWEVQEDHEYPSRSSGNASSPAAPPSDGYPPSIIDGFTDGFHFYPVIVDGHTAIIQLHLKSWGEAFTKLLNPAKFVTDNRVVNGRSTKSLSRKDTGRRCWM
jgi:hypothetical protein